ncbi:unnamed protein product [Schistosoma turkestanicum]|nr:unnamed protein product [Schistosoma turkestanicum]
MGVRGLTTYLESDPRNFIDYQLHNTTVVIDALNFLNFLYFDSELYTQFNGEYLAFSGVINRFINSLKRCGINPIFVFDGCHEHFKLNTQVKRSHQRMQTCRTLLNHVKNHNLPPTNTSYYVELLPPLTTVTLVQALNTLNIDYVTSDGEADQDVISLGIYLHCPVISNDSDFYVTIPSNKVGVCFLPLSLMSFEPIINTIKCNACHKHNKICAYLKCQQFLTNGPGLKNLPDVQRPLFASLLGNDYVKSSTFLKALPISQGKTMCLNRNATKSMKMKRRKLIIMNLIQWLSNFGLDINKPIKCILDKYPKFERSKLRIELIQSLQSYRTDPELLYTTFAKHLKSLKANNTTPINTSCLCENDKHVIEFDTCNSISSSSSSNSCSSSSSSSSSNTMNSKTILQQLSSCSSEYDSDINENQVLNIEHDESKHAVVEHNDHDDDDDDGCLIGAASKSYTNEYMYTNSFKVTSYWPDELLNSFRNYLILPIFVDSILSYGSVWICSLEALHDCRSIHSNAIHLRSLIYNLILGIESSVTFRYPNQLIGLQKFNKTSYYIIEFDRKGSFHINRRKVSVKPMKLSSLINYEMNALKDRRLLFLLEYFNLDVYHFIESDNNINNNNWLIVVALINVLTFQSKRIPLHTDHVDDITQCPISLTFGAICICAYLLISHYNYSGLSYCKPLNKHFYQCANYFIKQFNLTPIISKTSKNLNTIQDQHTLKIHSVHYFAQLQIFYITISTLIHLLDSLVTNEEREKLPTCLNLPPICSIFPSGYLFHEIYYCINLIQSNNNERYQYVRNVIIEKLMNYQNNNSKHLNDALNLFDRYLEISSIQSTKSFMKRSIKIKSVESNFVDKLEQSQDNAVMEQNLLPMPTEKSVAQVMKRKVNKKHKPKKHFKQPSFAEIEDRVAKLMLENGLCD